MNQLTNEIISTTIQLALFTLIPFIFFIPKRQKRYFFEIYRII